MILRRTLLLLPLLAACSTGTKQLAARFQAPAGLAPFRGYVEAKRKCPGASPLGCLDGTHLYLAVASTSGDELRIVDPEDGAVVPSEMLVFPLSIPVEMPVRVVSTSLGDGKADLLVAASQASAVLHVVNTWDGRPRIAGTFDLATLAPGASIVALAAMPVPAGAPVAPPPPATCADPGPPPGPTRPCRIGTVPEPATSAPLPGSARILAALSTGALAVIELQRDGADPAGAIQIATGSRVRLLPLRTTQLGTGATLPFQVRDLAVSPDGWRIFVATGDTLFDRSGAPVHGVAQISAWDDIADIDVNPLRWPIAGLDALAATRLVAAGAFAEREPPGADPLAPITFLDTVQLDVLAVLDEGSPLAACGPPAIDCGIVTLTPDDPARPGIAADPVGELPYRAPIRLPAEPTALAMVMPKRPFHLPADPPLPAGDLATIVQPPSDRERAPVMVVGQTGNPRQTTALLAAGLMNGQVFLVDPARWTASLVGSHVRDAGRAQVLVPPTPQEPTTARSPLFGIWNDVESNDLWPGKAAKAPLYDPALLVDSKMSGNFAFTPGYLPGDGWFLEWHGPLPSLTNRRAVLQPCGSGSPAACASGVATLALQEKNLSGTGWIATGRISDPSLGVLVGDSVVVACRDAQGVETSLYSAAVVGIVEPDPADPSFPGGALVIDTAGPTGCEALPDPGRTVVIDVRAGGMLLRGNAFGYAGRPTLSPDAASTGDFLEIPEAPGSDPRANRVKAAVALKARRRSYPADVACGTPNLLTIKLYCDQGALFPPDINYFATDTRPAYDPLLMGPATRGAGADLHRFMLRLRAGAQCAPPTATAPADTSSCLGSLDSAIGLAAPGILADGTRQTTEYGFNFASVDGVSFFLRQSSGLAVPTSVVSIDRSQYPSTAGTLGTEVYASFLDNQIIFLSPTGSSLSIIQ